MSNLIDCKDIRDVQWNPDGNVEVVRFGLSAEQIVELGLPWIENLRTAGKGDSADLGNSKHPDYNKPYAANYRARFGLRKVEANALAAHPEAAERIVEEAITRHVPASWPGDYAARIAPHVAQAREIMVERLKTFRGD